MLEHPGEVVRREELRQKLWPADTFVDFDHSLGNAINKIREALGDSADSPRFVETLPQRGYRFVAAIEEVRARHGVPVPKMVGTHGVRPLEQDSTLQGTRRVPLQHPPA